MNTKQWQVTISHPDYCPESQTFALTTDRLHEMTRNKEFSKMIDESRVLGGLIAAVEAIRDQTL
jgi:hypothetical protein